jgi:protein phosphatase
MHQQEGVRRSPGYDYTGSVRSITRELARVRAAAGKTDVGRKRAHNEDSVLVRTDLGLFLVADGAGGHASGEVASRMAVTSIADFFDKNQAESANRPDYDEFGLATGERWLARAIKHANRDIVEAGAATRDHKGMGTTIVAASVSPRSGLLHVAHVGDSRCYRLRMGHLERLTQDHSLMVEVLEQRPDIDDATLAQLPTNVITRALGVDANLRISVRTQRLDAADRYLLCSDGLWNSLGDDEIAHWLGEGVTAEQTVETLILQANLVGGDDNIGVLVLLCAGMGGSPEPRADTPAAAAAAASRKSIRPGRDESTPEIMVLGIEEVDLDPPNRARAPDGKQVAPAVAPATAARAEPLPQLKEGERLCRECKSPFDTDYCPFCGTKGNPLP